LLLFDEVQTGIGRTGRFLACQHDAVVPDALALAKALGGGVPIGVMLCRAAFAEALPPGSHGSTFGGNPLASAAALAVLQTLEEEGLVQAASQLGDYLGAGLAELGARHPNLVACERGRGLLRALILRPGTDARAMLDELREAGVLLTAAGAHGLRFSPPLVISRAEIDEGLSAVDKVLRAHS
jgi:acetylornithine/N-succinyldiaminopimelate aminotransferase